MLEGSVAIPGLRIFISEAGTGFKGVQGKRSRINGKANQRQISKKHRKLKHSLFNILILKNNSVNCVSWECLLCLFEILCQVRFSLLDVCTMSKLMVMVLSVSAKDHTAYYKMLVGRKRLQR